MNEVDLFNAVSEIDGELIEKYAETGKQSAGRGRPGKRSVVWTAIGCAAVACLVAAGVVAAIMIVRLRGRTPAENSETPWLFSHYDSNPAGQEVQLDPEVNLPAPVPPSEEALKYAGLWINTESRQAIRFNTDGTAVYYMLYAYDLSSYKWAEQCYYEIADGRLKLIETASGSVALCKVEYHDSYITLKPEAEAAKAFVRTETELEDGSHVFSANDAITFRNIPWTYDAENLQISFGGSAVVFYWTDTETRVYKRYSWDANTDTVTFPDWHEPEGGSWTGRIENGQLVITSGSRSLTLYDPYEARDKSFPVNVFLNTGRSIYENRLIVFRPDGEYKIIMVIKRTDLNDEKTWVNCYTGRYELEGTPEDADGKYVTLYPSGEDCSFLAQGEDLRFFADYADPAGERCLFRREGDCVMLILKQELGTLTIKLYPYTGE